MISIPNEIKFTLHLRLATYLGSPTLFRIHDRTHCTGGPLRGLIASLKRNAIFGGIRQIRGGCCLFGQGSLGASRVGGGWF